MSNRGITIQLDAQAVRELFPEDSEARVELKHAVIANFVQHQTSFKLLNDDTRRFIEAHIAPMRKQVQETLDTKVTEIINEQLKQQGITYSWNNRVDIGDRLRTEIQQAAQLKINACMNQTLNQVQEEVNGKMREQVRSALSENVIKHNVLVELRKQIRTEIINDLGNTA